MRVVKVQNTHGNVFLTGLYTIHLFRHLFYPRLSLDSGLKLLFLVFLLKYGSPSDLKTPSLFFLSANSRVKASESCCFFHHCLKRPSVNSWHCQPKERIGWNAEADLQRLI